MLEAINDYIWSYAVLGLMLAAGAVFSVMTGFFQLRGGARILRLTLGSGCKRKRANGEISPFQAFTASLAASMGTGNIIGVALALSIGGAGAVFWMWISAFLGMMTAYAENYLASRYSAYGAGSLGYLSRALKSRLPAVIFAALCIPASFGMGNMAQSNSAAAALYAGCGINPRITGIIAALFCVAVVSGGIKRIGAATEKIIPALSIVYFIGGIAVIFVNISELYGAFADIFRGAFGLRAAGGGVSGVMLGRAVSEGLRRGAFSNEAGLGSMPMLNSHSGCNAEERGCWAILEVFFDTVIFCTLTALVILVTKSGELGADGAGTVIAAFSSTIGSYSGAAVSVCIALYGFATLVGWCGCGESCVRFLVGGRGVGVYRAAFAIMAFVGATIRLETVWMLSDIFNGLMAIPNLICILILSAEVVAPRKL